MDNRLDSLLNAIIEDDRACVKKVLSAHPILVALSIQTERYESSITHWIYSGDTALHVAAAAYRLEIADMLLGAGADPCAAKNRRLGQPLHYASDGYVNGASWDANRQVTAIRLLLNAGADIHAQDKNGATPLHRAVRTRCAAAVKCLLDAGADATAKNKSGSTPFHLAVQNTGRGGTGAEKAKAAQGEIIQAFLEHGVRTTLRDGKGKSVLDCAKNDWIRRILAENV